MENFVSLNGRMFCVEQRGNVSSPPLLYLHGGPGTGAYDFMRAQGDRLARKLRVIALDQRGVLRSAPLAPGECLSPADLVADAEALRAHLGLRSWSVLGHSFGGALAALYARSFPDSVERVIFECPSFDAGDSARSLLRRAAGEYRALGDEVNATSAERLASAFASPRELWDALPEMLGKLNGRRNALYVYGPDKNFFERWASEAPFPAELWARGAAHQAALVADGSFFAPVTPLLPGLRQPALLLTGRRDPVTSEAQRAAFLGSMYAGREVVFERSGHFPRVEEPERYAQGVLQFVLEGC